MAREITDMDGKARALAAVGRAMIEADRERALGLLDEAGQAARSVPQTHLRPFTLAAVAEAFADAGLEEHAEQTAHAIDPLVAAAGARALRSVVNALAAAGQWTAPSGPRGPFPASGRRQRPWPRWAAP